MYINELTDTQLSDEEYLRSVIDEVLDGEFDDFKMEDYDEFLYWLNQYIESDSFFDYVDENIIERKEFIIIQQGNKFKEKFTTNTLNEKGFFTKWKIGYNYNIETERYTRITTKSIQHNIEADDIEKSTIKKTKEWYNSVEDAEHPIWLRKLEDKTREEN